MEVKDSKCRGISAKMGLLVMPIEPLTRRVAVQFSRLANQPALCLQRRVDVKLPNTGFTLKLP